MRSGQDLGLVIADFLGDAEAGVVRAPGGKPYGRAELRDLRGTLAHVAAELGRSDIAALGSRDVRRLADELGTAGLRPERVEAILDALRAVYAYAVGRGLVTTSPLVGLAPPRTHEAPSPTTAMLAFGEHLATLAVRVMVGGLLLAAVGLAVVLV